MNRAKEIARLLMVVLAVIVVSVVMSCGGGGRRGASTLPSISSSGSLSSSSHGIADYVEGMVIPESDLDKLSPELQALFSSILDGTSLSRVRRWSGLSLQVLRV